MTLCIQGAVKELQNPMAGRTYGRALGGHAGPPQQKIAVGWHTGMTYSPEGLEDVLCWGNRVILRVQKLSMNNVEASSTRR